MRIPVKRLADAGYPTPVPDGEAAREVVSRVTAVATHRDELSDAVAKLTSARTKQLRTRDQELPMQRSAIESALSRIPDSVRASGRYVGVGQSVSIASRKAIESGIEERVAPARARGSLSLSPEQIDAVFGDGSTAVLSGDEYDEIVQTVAHANGNSPAASRQRIEAIELACRRSSDELALCEEVLDEGDGESGESGDGAEAPPSGDGAEPPHGDSEVALSLALERVLEAITRTVDEPALGLLRPATRDDVEESLATFSLRRGPADVPAHYDFFSLSIAFEHVWQEAFDGEAVDIAADLYRRIVELGGEPPTTTDPGEFVGGLDLETKLVGRAVVNGDPPASVVKHFDVTPALWSSLQHDQRAALIELGTKLDALNDAPLGINVNGTRLGRDLRRQGERILEYARLKAEEAKTDGRRLEDALSDLRRRLGTDYAFTVYAANRRERSINFGLLTHYRQRWEPVSYQAGDLVKTITLAPKEVRKFSTKHTIKQTRAEKTASSSESSVSTQRSETGRLETQIAEKAFAKNNFQTIAEGTLNLGVFDGDNTTTLAREASNESSAVKKRFRERVFKAAQQLKSKRSIEVSTSEEETFEQTTSGEISNPNAEIPVTYLFYELQRRYLLSERIHRVVPVVLVAQEVPAPDEIDDAWLVAHDWILRRVLLDSSFVPALVYLGGKMIGDELALGERRENLQQQRRLTEELQGRLVELQENTQLRLRQLQAAVERQADIAEDDEQEGVGTWITEWFSGDDQSPEKARLLKEAAQDSYDRAVAAEREMMARLERETTALNAASQAYASALQEHAVQRAEVERLKLHVKQNILYYMHAIWTHEPPDQRYFRLHNVEVPLLEGTRSYTLTQGTGASGGFPNWSQPAVDVESQVELSMPLELGTLAELADRDNLLGFKGNYMIFPLKESNALTSFMMTPYVDPVLGVRDPDPFGNWTLEEFGKYVCCLREKLDEGELNELRPALRKKLEELLANPNRAAEELVIPSGSLFVEALPGTHSVLEPYKLAHRAEDVVKVRAETQAIALDNLRRAKRLLLEELGDPDVERQIVVQGNAGLVVPTE